MARIFHGTLTANTVSSVTVESNTTQILITNRSQTGEIYATVDGSAPVIASNGYVVLGTRALVCPQFTGPTVVNLISNSALKYSVEGEPV